MGTGSITALASLGPVPEGEAAAYYTQLLSELGNPGVEVRLDAGAGKGKGIFATRAFSRGDLIFKERPLVCHQHVENRGQAIVCDLCHRHTGSVEQQIAHKLLSTIAAISRKAQGGQQADGADGQEEEEEEEVDMEEMLAAGERLEQIYANVSTEQLQALASGATKLPLTEQHPLPHAVPCRRGCGVSYCSSACEEAAWARHHCLLCRGEASSASGAPAAAGAAGAADAAGPSTSTSSGAGAGPSASASGSGSGSGGCSADGGSEEVSYCVLVHRKALLDFEAHAHETNDVFLLAARLLAGVILSASAKLKEGLECEGASSASASASASASGAAGGDAAGEAAAAVRALQEAWRPYALGWKKPWWEGVAVPEDVEDEGEFRQQLRDLASESLELLCQAVHTPPFAALLTLEVYGSVIGMFELNNLALAVPSPVEDYFLAVDGLKEEEGVEQARKDEVAKATQPLLDALDSDYCTPCETSAFLSLQSCANHSCEPAAEAMGEGSGEAAILALRSIQPGEEVTLSYIDEGMGYRERQAALADYGFKCACPRCVKDKAARAAKAASKQKAKLAAAAKKR